MATYRISVGRRQKVNPSQIVGALANEGGLRREDFGHIDIKVDHTLVELPAKLPQGGVRQAGPHPHLGSADRAAPRTETAPQGLSAASA